MPHSEETDRPSLGLICGSKYSLVVDAGNSPNHVKEFLSEVNQLNAAIPPLKYVVITHFHWDHMFGIKEMNLITIAHSNTVSEIEKMKSLKWDDASLEEYCISGIYNEFTINCIKKEMPDREAFEIGDIDITYEDCLVINLGDLKCIVKAIGGDHTKDASVIYVPEERVLFLGDCVYGGRYHDAYGYTKEKLYPMIDNIREFDAEFYIISHEEIYDKKEMDKFIIQITTAEQIVGSTTSIEAAEHSYVTRYNKQPSEDEKFYIGCFVDVNKARSGI